MTRAKWVAAALTVVIATSIGISTLFAQERPRAKPRTPPPRSTQPQEVTLSGKVVDLQCYMTGKFIGKNPEAGSRNCIRRGVPAALETENGLIVLGMAKGNSSKLAPHAMKLVELRGTLYEKHGVKYLEVASIKKLKALERKPEPEDEPEEEPEEDPDERPEDEPEPEPEPDPEPPDDPDSP